jgi:hypothetical protein
MSTSFATYLIQAFQAQIHLLVPRPPPAKSSPVGKVYKYSQYQKFGIDETFLRGDFDKSKFLEFLNVELPKSIPDVPSRGKEFFLTLANKVAKSIKDQREH